MMRTTAHFIKDVIGPKGSASIIPSPDAHKDSANVSSHITTKTILLHHAELNTKQQFSKQDSLINMTDEPDHNKLCLYEQQALLNAIQQDHDLSEHWQNAIDSLSVV